MKHKTVVIVAAALFIFIAGFLSTKSFIKKQKVHYHAGFQVYVDGKLQDFSGLKYMLIKPCSEDDEKRAEDEQSEKAHLHDQIGDVIHVEAENAKWKDLFANIHFSFNKSKSLISYLNGKKTENILDQPIKAFDSAVVFSGKNPNRENALKERVGKERIEQIGKKSESCDNT